MFTYSIIIPHYNSPTLLDKLIRTIPARDDIEIIVIDDNSEQLLELSQFSRHNISFYINDTGIQSAGACRNIGLKHAKGRWLLFADADDFFLEDAFEIINEVADEQYDVIYFSPTSRNSINNEISDRHINYQKLVRNFISNNEMEIKYSFYVPWSKLISSKLVKDKSIVFDETLVANDVMFSLRVGLNAKRITAVDRVIYCVIKRTQSLTSVFNPNNNRIRFETSLRMNAYLYRARKSCYQHSLCFLLKRHYKIIKLQDLRDLFYLVLSGKLIILPPLFKKSFYK